MTRYIEHGFRVWWLWLLALLVPAAVIGATLYTQPTQYDAQMTIWVEDSNYLEVPTENSWTTPAQEQADLFNQLISTRSFLAKMVEGTELAPYAGNEQGKDFLEDHFSRRLKVNARGGQLVEVTYRTTERALGVALLNSFIKQATAHTTATTREQARVAEQFYAALLPQREKEMLDATSALRDYAAKNSATIDRATSDRLLDQIEIGELRRREELARKRYEDTIAALDRVRMQSGALETVQQRGFRIIDEPFVPARPVALRRELLLPLGAAAGGSLALALGVTLLLVWFDRSLRYRDQISNRLQLPVLGTIPSYRRYRRKADPRRVAAQALTLRPATAGD